MDRHPAQSAAPQPPQRRVARGERSCDTCRRRKLKCVREAEQARCVLCMFHQRDCTYLDAPQQRRKRRRKGEATAAEHVAGAPRATVGPECVAAQE